MKRTIFLILAVFVGFGAFAQNPQLASAPNESISEFVSKLAGKSPQGRSALSAMSVAPRPSAAPLPIAVPKMLPAESEVLNENIAPLHFEDAAPAADAAPLQITVGDSGLPVPSETPVVSPATVASAATTGKTDPPAKALAPAKNPAQTAANFCDQSYVGEPLTFTQTMDLKLNDLLNQIHRRYGINFLMGGNIGDAVINLKTNDIPWNVLLRSQLFLNGIRARCLNGNTIELVKNEELSRLRDTAEVETRFVKLKFLQRTTQGSVDLAGRSQGGGQGGCSGMSGGGGQSGSGGQSGGGGGGQNGETAATQGSSKFDQLVKEIEKILGLRSMTESSVGGNGGQSQNAANVEEIRTDRFVTQIPGRNILMIRATDYEHDLIDQIISRADRPPFQVVIKGLVYTASQDRLRDIGVELSWGEGNPSQRTSGGVFGHTIGSSGTLFDFSTIMGTFDFNVQATAFQENGVISVKSRPFATVLDGLCTTLNVGRELPIVIDSTLGGQGDVVFVNAANNLAVTPYVVDDENGNPMAVTLDLRLDANELDSSVTARGIPAVSRRSIQTQLLLGEEKTAILGGFTVDQDSRTVSKTPGLGDIPIIGELFKRRIRDTRVNRLYFAITATVVPYGEAIRPVDVPGATTDPPSVTPAMLERSKKGEQEQVTDPAFVTQAPRPNTQKAKAEKTGP